MSEELVEYIMQGISLLYNAIVLIAIGGLFTITAVFSAAVNQQEANGAKMRAYAEYNQFNGTHCYQQDVISTIYEYRGNPAVEVTFGGSTYTWSTSSSATVYKTKEIADKITENVIYDADVELDTNGQVKKIKFVACPGETCSRGG